MVHYAVVGSGASVADLAAESDTGTEGEGTVMPDEFLGAPARPWPNCRRIKLLGVACAIAALLARLLVEPVARHSSVVESIAAKPPLASASATSAEEVSSRTGCSNWRHLLLRKYLNRTKEQCKSHCNVTKNCYSYNYQPGECKSSQSSAARTCYLLSEGCERERNSCWDLYTNPSAPGWISNASRTGCSNWRSLRVGEVIEDTSLSECGVKCGEQPNCKHFNFQPGPCAGSEMVGKGACYLLKDGCQPEGNTCWDLYSLLPRNIVVWTVAWSTPKGSTLVTVDRSASFKVGQNISIRYRDGSAQTDAVITSILENNSLALSQAITRQLFGGELVYIDASMDKVYAPGTVATVSSSLRFGSTGSQAQVLQASQSALQQQLGVPQNQLDVTVAEQAQSFQRRLSASELDREVKWAHNATSFAQADDVYRRWQQMSDAPQSLSTILGSALQGQGASLIDGTLTVAGPRVVIVPATPTPAPTPSPPTAVPPATTAPTAAPTSAPTVEPTSAPTEKTPAPTDMITTTASPSLDSTTA